MIIKESGPGRAGNSLGVGGQLSDHSRTGKAQADPTQARPVRSVGPRSLTVSRIRPGPGVTAHGRVIIR
eukprot:761659-Hanusia_phi.AAC.3